MGTLEGGSKRGGHLACRLRPRHVAQTLLTERLDASLMGFEFGVTSTQAAARQALAASGDPRLEGISVASFKPAAGLKELRGAASLGFLLTERTRLLAFAQNAQLSAEAGRSPLVRSRNSSVADFAIMRAF